MKRLTDYIPKIQEKYIINNKDIILEDNYIGSSFDTFVKLNCINDITPNIYKVYIQENFNKDKHRYYKKYQDHLYESIVNSYNASNKIYNEFNGIIYHITSKEIYYNNIKNKELKPKWKRNNTYRDGRIFFIANNNDKTIQKQLQSIANLKNIQDPIVLKINLNEYKNKLRFRIDSSADGFDAYFTEEPIPDFCITCIDLNTWKEIKKPQVF